MDAAMRHPKSFHLEVDTFPNPGSILVWTIHDTVALHDFRFMAVSSTIPRGSH